MASCLGDPGPAAGDADRLRVDSARDLLLEAERLLAWAFASSPPASSSRRATGAEAGGWMGGQKPGSLVTERATLVLPWAVSMPMSPCRYAARRCAHRAGRYVADW
jgi:hypothetical protein